MLAKKTLELNPHHPVIKEMLTKVKEADGGEVDTETTEYAELLYNMALLNSGFLIENPNEFTLPLNRLLKLGFGLRKDAPIEEVEVDISAEDEEEAEEEEESEEGGLEIENLDGGDTNIKMEDVVIENEKRDEL